MHVTIYIHSSECVDIRSVSGERRAICPSSHHFYLCAGHSVGSTLKTANQLTLAALLKRSTYLARSRCYLSIY